MARCGCCRWRCRFCCCCCVVHSTLLLFVVVVYVINIDFNLLLPHSKLISVNNCSASGPSPFPISFVLCVFWSAQYAKKVKIELGRSIGSGRGSRWRGMGGLVGWHKAGFYFSSTFALTWRRLLLLVIQLTFSLNTLFHPHTTPPPPPSHYLIRDRRPSNLLTQFGP